MNTTAARALIHRHPLAFSAVVTATAAGVEVLMKVAAELVSVRPPVITAGILSGAVVSLLGAAAVGRLGLWRELGLVGRPARPRTLLWFLPFALVGVLPLTRGLDVTAGAAAAAAVFGLLIAFWKLVVLGLMLFALLPGGARSATAVAALFFAGLHLAGILTGGAVAPTLVLALSYAFLAVAFTAVWLRTGLLWPLVASYSLLLATSVAGQVTESSNLAASVADILPLLVLSIVLAAYGLLAWPRRGWPAGGWARSAPAVGAELDRNRK